MKHGFLFFAIVVCFIQHGFAQIDSNNASPLSLENQTKITVQLKPLIDEMGERSIVGLGEGTHGTKEFNDIRIAIIKELVAKKGFNTICFENAFGDSYYLNKLINTREDITAGMKKYLLAIWQTAEIRDFLFWIRKYNKTHSTKVSFSGMDFPLMANTAKIIKEELKGKDNNNLEPYATMLYNNACYYDSIWTNQNDTSFHFSFDAVVAKMKDAYIASVTIDSLSSAAKLKTSDDFKTALLNIQYWYKGALGEEASRDQYMANMAMQFAKRKNCKLIVWAHEVHLALKSPYDNKRVGGTGGYIKNQHPGYYVLGLGTASGTYSATTDRYDSRINIFRPYPLAIVKSGTWDEACEKEEFPAFFILSSQVKTTLLRLPLRVVGYGTGSDDYSDKNALNELFDAYIFIRKTTATDHNL
jgi:erythromycin esterase